MKAKIWNKEVEINDRIIDTFINTTKLPDSPKRNREFRNNDSMKEDLYNTAILGGANRKSSPRQIKKAVERGMKRLSKTKMSMTRERLHIATTRTKTFIIYGKPVIVDEALVNDYEKTIKAFLDMYSDKDVPESIHIGSEDCEYLMYLIGADMYKMWSSEGLRFLFEIAIRHETMNLKEEIEAGGRPVCL